MNTEKERKEEMGREGGRDRISKDKERSNENRKIDIKKE